MREYVPTRDTFFALALVGSAEAACEGVCLTFLIPPALGGLVCVFASRWWYDRADYCLLIRSSLAACASVSRAFCLLFRLLNMVPCSSLAKSCTLPVASPVYRRSSMYFFIWSCLAWHSSISDLRCWVLFWFASRRMRCFFTLSLSASQSPASSLSSLSEFSMAAPAAAPSFPAMKLGVRTRLCRCPLALTRLALVRLALVRLALALRALPGDWSFAAAASEVADSCFCAWRGPF